MSRRIAYVTSAFPRGTGEAYLGPEFSQLVALGAEPVAIPVRPYGDVLAPSAMPHAMIEPLISGAVLWAALRTLVRHPLGSLRAMLLVLRTRRRAALVRNLAALPKAMWLARVVEREGIEHIHAHWAGPPSTVAMIAAQIAGVPWSMTAHFADIAAGNLLDHKSRSATFVRFISAEMMALARRTAPGADERRWVLVHLGVEVPPTWTEPPPVGPTAVVLMAARFDAEKRHEWAVRAVAHLRDLGIDAELWCAGTGPLEAEVRAAAAREGGGEWVRFLGFVASPVLLGLLRDHQVDLMVLPSEGEGIPVSLMEALAAGVPAVACDVGGVPELLGEGCGGLVAADDHEGFNIEVCRLLTDQDLRTQVARQGRRRVEEEFSVEVTAARLIELIGATAP